MNRDKKLRGFDKALGRVIASKRVLKEISQAQLAERSGVALSLIGRIEAGTRSVSVAELETFADVLGVPAETMASEAVDEYGGLRKLMSEATATTDELAKARAQKAARAMTDEEIDDTYERGGAAAQKPAGDEDDDEPST